MLEFRPGAIYYVNQYTGEVQWDFPTEEAKPSSEVRASHILRKHKVRNIIKYNRIIYMSVVII